MSLLGNGKVLVTGGCATANDGFCADAKILASVELFDPAGNHGQGTWTTLAPMASPRRRHTATVLSDGRVLVVGGTNSIPASAEIFNPATGKWSAAPSLLGPREHDHRATLLGDDKVLITGGSTPSGHPLASAEVFDPTAVGGAGAWQRVGTMSTARRRHTASRLADGSVLAVGGDDTTAALTVVERYDPASGLWRVAAPLSGPRTDHSATVTPDGKVVVVGGGTGRSSQDIAALDSTETYDPTSASWHQGGTSMSSARSGHVAVALSSGQVLVAGNYRRPFPDNPSAAQEQQVRQELSTAERFDPSTTTPAPAVIRINPPLVSTAGTTVALTGRWLTHASAVTVGERHATDLQVISDTEMTAKLPPGLQGRAELRVVSPHGTSRPLPFTYAGGIWAKASLLDSCTPTPASCTGRGKTTMTVLDNGQVLVAGGFTNINNGFQVATSAQIYDPRGDTWRATAPMQLKRYAHTATLLSGPGCGQDCGKVLVVAGESSNWIPSCPTLPQSCLSANVGAASIIPTAGNSVELYDPTGGSDGQGSWEILPSLAQMRYDHTATRLADGRVLVVGGITHEYRRSTPLNSVEVYDPATRKWTTVAPISKSRVNHTATLLTDGRVLVVGGLTTDPELPPSQANLLGNGSGTALVATSAEIYDPATDRWSDTGELTVGRFSHSATLLSGPGCADQCGRVLVAGGRHASSAPPEASTELYDPVTGRWDPAPSLITKRGDHVAILLATGRVLVTGNASAALTSNVNPEALAATEEYDPASRGGGIWRTTSEPSVAFGGGMNRPIAVALDPTECGTATAGQYPCGAVLLTGRSKGVGALTQPDAELYWPAPSIDSVTPAKARPGATIEISGGRLGGARSINFDEVASPATTVNASRVTALAPPHPKGPVGVAVLGADGQTSATTEPSARPRFTYIGDPDRTVLQATPRSKHEVQLSFAAPDDGTTLAPAQAYLVRQSDSPIDDEADFEAATALCPEGICRDFVVTEIGQVLTLDVGDLEPATRYHYAIKAVAIDGGHGPLSDDAVATTFGKASKVEPKCLPVSAPVGGQLLLDGGRYQIVSGPGGTVVGSDSPLFGWSDAGAGGSYSQAPGDQPVASGKGYWAWSRCDRLISLAGRGTRSVDIGLGAYHASMIGNPSSLGPATATGHDFIATWDPAGESYSISGYREPMTLGVGRGAWAFSYRDTQITIEAGP